MTDAETRSENPVVASAQKLRQEFDRWIEAAMAQGGKALNALGLKGGSRPWTPAIDILETADSVRVLVNLPGVDPAKVDVAIAGNMLTIKGESPGITVGDSDSFHVQQRNSGVFERSIPMPVPVDPERVCAEARYGVLTVCLAKTERTQSRQIPVRSNDPTPGMN